MSNASTSFQDGIACARNGREASPSLDGATDQDFVLDFGFVLELDREKLCKFLPCAIDPALDSADGAFTDVSGLLVREARGPDQNERLALIRREVKQRLTEFSELDMPSLSFR